MNEDDPLVLFGSRSNGTATDESDVDLLLIMEDIKRVGTIQREAKEFLPEIRFEIHHFKEEDIFKGSDLVLTDAILHGISFHGPRSLFVKRNSIDSVDDSAVSEITELCSIVTFNDPISVDVRDINDIDILTSAVI